jgi:hypothetical protein
MSVILTSIAIDAMFLPPSHPVPSVQISLVCCSDLILSEYFCQLLSCYSHLIFKLYHFFSEKVTEREVSEVFSKFGRVSSHIVTVASLCIFLLNADLHEVSEPFWNGEWHLVSLFLPVRMCLTAWLTHFRLISSSF